VILLNCPDLHSAAPSRFCLSNWLRLTSCVLRRLSLGGISSGHGSGQGPSSQAASVQRPASARTPRNAMSRLGPRPQRPGQQDQNTAPPSSAVVAMTERGRPRVAVAEMQCGSATARHAHASAAARRTSVAAASAGAGVGTSRRAQAEGGGGKASGQRWS